MLLLLALGKVVWDDRRALRRLPLGFSDQRFILHAAIAATLGISVVSCFDVSLGDSEILGLYLTVVALGYSTVRTIKTLPKRPTQ